MKLTVTKSEYKAIPGGLYFADIEELEDTEGKYGPQLQFNLRIAGGEQDGHELRAWANPTLSTRSKLYRWLDQMNFDLSVGATVDLDRLVGQRVLIKVENSERDDGSEYNKVTELMSTDVAQQLQAPATKPEPEPEPQPQVAGNGDVDLDALRQQLEQAAA